MAAASDKARFYLEQHVPELNEYARKGLFTAPEIHSITARRSAFEHTLAARGSIPTDYARYAEYETNLATLLKKRCKRLGIKGTKGYSGQRTVFFILERGTKKFSGDVGLWVQYIRFCQKEKASKKLAKVFTGCLRLKPREWGLWVMAAKWYAEEQGDMQTARGYMQRALRFCKEERRLWVEYAKLETVYLAKLAARRKILGVDEERKGGVTGGEEDKNVIPLPIVTAADIGPDAIEGMEEVDAAALQRSARAPAFTGAIPIAIFDAAMKQFHNSPEVAEAFFELIATFHSVPAATLNLQHILAHLLSTAPESPEAILCEAKMHTFSIAASHADFPAALGKSLARIKTGLAAVPEKQKEVLAEKAVLMLLPFLDKLEELDEDVATVLIASLHRYSRILAATLAGMKSGTVKILAERVKTQGKLSGDDILEIGRQGKDQG